MKLSPYSSLGNYAQLDHARGLMVKCVDMAL